MRKLVGRRFLSGVVVLLCAGPLYAQDADDPPSCHLTRIIDGDTIECRLAGVKQSVRLLGIDAPEARQGPYGKRATAALGKLLRKGSEVVLELDVRERDSRGRLLAYVWNEDAVMVNEALLERGFAVVYIEPPNVKHADVFRQATQKAQDGRVGLWATKAFSCLPVDFRRKKCR